jgi:hypothetical protein
MGERKREVLGKARGEVEKRGVLEPDRAHVGHERNAHLATEFGRQVGSWLGLTWFGDGD